MIESMLTTTDNPYSPFDEFDEWRAFDERMGYYTLPFLARVTVTSNDLSEADELLANEDAIDEIISENVLGIYKRVTRQMQS